MDPTHAAAATEQRLRGLLLAGMAGDAAAYQRFLADVSRHLRAYFRRRLAQLPDEVEDLVQESLLALHRQRHTYRPELPLTAWLHAIARYKLVDLLRARSRREALHDPLDDDLQILAASDSDAVDTRKDLDRLLDSLPERQRMALVMIKIEGASVAETAAATGLSPASVKVGVHRALRTLAARFKGQT